MLAPPPGPPIQSASRSPIGWRRPRDQIGELSLADTDHAVKLEASDWLALSLVHLQYHVRTGMSTEPTYSRLNLYFTNLYFTKLVLIF